MKKSGKKVLLPAACFLYLALLPFFISSADTEWRAPLADHVSEPVIFTLFPSGTLYPNHLAAQKNPRFALTFPKLFINAIDPKEPASDGGRRESIELGASRSLARLALPHQPDLGIELSIGMGIFTLFDSFSDGLDLFGFDGYGQIAVHYRPVESLSFRLGIRHISGHIGDEFLAHYDPVPYPVPSGQDLAKTDSYGMFYVRDSFLFGFSHTPAPAVRIYGEVNYSTRIMRYLYNYNQYPWQIHFGLELVQPKFFNLTESAESGSWYAAADVELHEESSWHPSLTLQAGRILKTGHSDEQVRIGLEYGSGRTLLTAFNHTVSPEPTPFDDIPYERYLSFGIWYDF